jgi:hypothetical protein
MPQPRPRPRRAQHAHANAVCRMDDEPYRMRQTSVRGYPRGADIGRTNAQCAPHRVATTCRVCCNASLHATSPRIDNMRHNDMQRSRSSNLATSPQLFARERRPHPVGAVHSESRQGCGRACRAGYPSPAGTRRRTRRPRARHRRRRRPSAPLVPRAPPCPSAQPRPRRTTTTTTTTTATATTQTATAEKTVPEPRPSM